MLWLAIIAAIFIAARAQDDAVAVEEHIPLERNKTYLDGLLNKGKAQQVLDLFSDLTVIDPPEVTICIGRAYAQLGQYAKTENLLKPYIASTPDSVEALLTLGKVYVQVQRWNDAEQYLEKVISLDPTNHQAFNFLGKVVLVRDQNSSKAKEYLSEAHRLDPTDENILFEYGMILLYNDEHDDAKEAFNKAELLNKEMDHAILGKIYLHYKHTDWYTQYSI